MPFIQRFDRTYAQRLPTPGYDAFTDAVLGAGTSAAVANGYGPDSPFNSDLPYNIKQFAIFGEGNYDITDRLTFTAGGRYYDFKEVRTLPRVGSLPMEILARSIARNRRASPAFPAEL